jgi:ABC-type Fe3+-hydroxamate transport system substrate-binding protein
VLQLAQEAYACEEKEEKLVTDAVKHLTEANFQIKDLYDQFTVKVSYLHWRGGSTAAPETMYIPPENNIFPWSYTPIFITVLTQSTGVFCLYSPPPLCIYSVNFPF